LGVDEHWRAKKLQFPSSTTEKPKAQKLIKKGKGKKKEKDEKGKGKEKNAHHVARTTDVS
tara:strand:+ start:511 stop:690 length:180 start_codon:yes stop_codon:yes gene_type:complete